MLSTRKNRPPALTLGAWLAVFVSVHAFGQSPPATKPAKNQPAEKPDQVKPKEEGKKTPSKGATIGEGLKRLTPKFDIWLDPKRKLVVVEGKICLRRGALEMFACPMGTKEHESIIAVNCKAWHVHAALVAVGAKPVHPVQFDPTYKPAEGTEIEIDILWRDKENNVKRASAKEWVVDGDQKPLKYPWVFGGSRFYKDEMTGQEHYLAEDGDLICVSNFTTATMDLPIQSSADAGRQLFYANTEKIPPQETVVRLVLRPKLKPAAKNAGKSPEKKGDGTGKKQ